MGSSAEGEHKGGLNVGGAGQGLGKGGRRRNAMCLNAAIAFTRINAPSSFKELGSAKRLPWFEALCGTTHVPQAALTLACCSEYQKAR